MKDLTEKQQELLDYIKWHLAQNGRPPTYREMMVGVEAHNTNVLVGRMAALVAKGAVEIDKNMARGIRVVEKEREHAE